MEKGVTVSQVAQVAYNFTEAGIMVHAYLMYGFPTQTAQETIDSLEMVRQLFEQGALQSGFWHLFSMTAHSPVGLDPAAYGVIKSGPVDGGFANNDLIHEDPSGCDHEMFSEGLAKALFNYMHGIGFETPLHEWFDFKVPRTTVPPTYIERAISGAFETLDKAHSQVTWLGNIPKIQVYQKQKKGKTYPLMKLVFENKAKRIEITSQVNEGQWLSELIPQIQASSTVKYTFSKIAEDFENKGLGSFTAFTKSQTWSELRKEGLLLV